MIIALDTETTGVDLYHAACPFYVSITYEDMTKATWRWNVDPLTRDVLVEEDDLDQIKNEIDQADEIVLQNSKFDYCGLLKIMPDLPWDWNKVRDTLIGGHLLYSNEPHDLSSMSVQYLGKNIQPLEDNLEKAVQECRRFCRNKLKGWKIAREGLPGHPSIKKTSQREEDKPWRNDMWLPHALRKAGHFKTRVDFDSVMEKYSDADSAHTLGIHNQQMVEIKERGLEKIYYTRLKLLPIVSEMERKGVSLSKAALMDILSEYRIESLEAEATLINIAAGLGYNLSMPKGASPNKSLRVFMLDILKLEPQYDPKSKSGEPTLNKEAMTFYANTLPSKSKELSFVTTLLGKRARDTACSYMESYKKFWVPTGEFNSKGQQLWYRLHPSLNPTGTATLRWSCHNPNEQNISKKEDFNVRRCFGPEPGREWWSLDYKNLERRIPAYYANEEDIIALFERPGDGPYYGSEHLLVAHLLFPREFETCRDANGELDGRIFKKKYASTLYQRIKNGNFAVQYGAVDRDDGEGTADRTYGVKGAQRRIKIRFAKQEKLNQDLIAFADRHGYVETIPDTTVDPDHGYPLLCSRGSWGKIKPTLPLNYWGQGTACWEMMMAMIRSDAQLKQWEEEEQGFDPFITLQVHDELVLDMPKVGDPTIDPATSNLWRVQEIACIMESCGDGIGIPTPVNIEYHSSNWAKGVTFGYERHLFAPA